MRRAVPRQTKQALQLDLFEPRHIDHEYRVVVTNKMNSPRSVLLFHYGRGAQEGIFAEAKQQAGLDLIPTPTVARQPDGYFVCDDGPQSGTRNADAGAAAIELFARQTAGGVDLPNLGHRCVIASFNAPGASLSPRAS